MVERARLTRNLLASARTDDAVRAWSATMPDEVDRIARAWDLELGPAYEPGGRTAWVAQVRTAGGEELVLKVGMVHPEGKHEADALRVWDGRGSVRLHRHDSDGRTTALLLERCRPGTPLTERPEDEQDHVVASVLRRTWSTPLSGTTFRHLSELCTIWADATAQRLLDGLLPGDPVLVEAAVELLRGKAAVATSADVLLCTDLHAGNVLASTREPWLLIDPKPFVGDRSYDLVQHLLNCRGRLLADPRGLVARLADLTDVDPSDLRDWTFARAACELAWSPGLEPVVRALAP